MWPGFDFQTRCHMWVEFVGSLLFFANLTSTIQLSKMVIKINHHGCSLLQLILHCISSDSLWLCNLLGSENSPDRDLKYSDSTNEQKSNQCEGVPDDKKKKKTMWHYETK